IFDALEESEGQERVRLAICWLHRSADDVEGLAGALEDAAGHARTTDLRADLDLERAMLLIRFGRPLEAHALVTPHFEDDRVSPDLRAGGARILVDDLISGDPARLSVEALTLKERALA